MSSSILDLSLSRGATASADTSSSGHSARSCTPPSPSTPLLAAELRVSTTDHGHCQAAAASPDDDSSEPELATSAHATSVSGSSSDVVDDTRPRDVGRAPYPPYWTDLQAAAAARFLVPFLPSPGSAAAGTGSSPMTSSLNFYQFPFPGMPPHPPPASLETGFNFRPDGMPARSRSSEPVAAKVKDDCTGSAPMTSSPTGSVADPTYAERRRKNNEAARRSRDARRMKERETCLRAALLQQENVRLRAEMAVLKTEVARLHCLLYEKM